MMKEKYNIRLLVKEDVNEIVNLVRISFDNTYLIPSIYRAKGIVDFISSELENPFSPYRYFVLWDKNTIAGYAEYKIFESTSTAFLNIISVNSEYKNKGIGRILYDYCKNYFIENGLKKVALDVYESNTIAFNWYSKLGFQKLSSTSLSKINFKLEKKISKVYIQNYSQFKACYELYGFYFLDIVYGKNNSKLGIIDNDIFIRNNYCDDLMDQLPFLLKTLKLENLYFLGNSNDDVRFKFIDTIIRMELNI
ncbi:GNAT family N-acetyltransferase [Flavobacterium sp. P4023]|uniref:GNAT family N-acetyltransferase n=1 Tax=Flavobacterium flabelliforme TaxID=2816119 RepID=A0ABS5CSC9_9FLAO|nr:GNAT family N-acetyltransferase [Flavobacterium flabelliforme]MBP4141518.1 GNAT family N-acetyltransferase [Flavobacterium flabelliforme]